MSRPEYRPFNLFPFAMPPQYSSLYNKIFHRDRHVDFVHARLLDISASAEISLVPVAFSDTPILAYSSAPRLMIGTTAASVSTLFTTVGRSQAPFTSREGRLDAWVAAFAFQTFKSMLFLHHRYTLRRRGAHKSPASKPVPRIFFPRKPFALCFADRCLPGYRRSRHIHHGYKYN